MKGFLLILIGNFLNLKSWFLTKKCFSKHYMSDSQKKKNTIWVTKIDENFFFIVECSDRWILIPRTLETRKTCGSRKKKNIVFFCIISFGPRRKTKVSIFWPKVQKNSILATDTKKEPLRSHIWLPRLRIDHQ